MNCSKLPVLSRRRRFGWTNASPLDTKTCRPKRRGMFGIHAEVARRIVHRGGAAGCIPTRCDDEGCARPVPPSTPLLRDPGHVFVAEHEAVVEHLDAVRAEHACRLLVHCQPPRCVAQEIAAAPVEFHAQVLQRTSTQHTVRKPLACWRSDEGGRNSGPWGRQRRHCGRLRPSCLRRRLAPSPTTGPTRNPCHSGVSSTRVHIPHSPRTLRRGL